MTKGSLGTKAKRVMIGGESGGRVNRQTRLGWNQTG